MTHSSFPFRHDDREMRLIFQGPETRAIKSEFEDSDWSKKKNVEGTKKLDAEEAKNGLIDALVEGDSPSQKADKYAKKADTELAKRKARVQAIDDQNAKLAARVNTGGNGPADGAAEIAKDAALLGAGVLLDQPETKSAPVKTEHATTITSHQTAENTSSIERNQARTKSVAATERPGESGANRDGSTLSV